jgi:hypothetical protein
MVHSCQDWIKLLWKGNDKRQFVQSFSSFSKLILRLMKLIVRKFVSCKEIKEEMLVTLVFDVETLSLQLWINMDAPFFKI